MLGMLEMLCGRRLHNYANFEKYCDVDYWDESCDRYKEHYYYTYFYYHLDNKRHIVGIQVHPDGLNDGECWFDIVPEQLSSLKYLKPEDNAFRVG